MAATHIPSLRDDMTAYASSDLLNFYSTKFIFGLNPDVDTVATEDIWQGPSSAYIFPPDTGEEMELVSDNVDDTALLMITGLDDNFEEKEETFNVTGTTPVNIGIWSRINDMVNANGVEVLGTVDVRTSGGGNVYARITADHQTLLQAIFTVPEGKTAFVYQVGASVVGNNNTDVDIIIKIRLKGGVKQTGFIFGINRQGSSVANVMAEPTVRLRSGTDIIASANTDMNDAGVTSFFNLLIIDNAQLKTNK